MIEAFIFDLDGVIVDTAKYHYTAWEALAKGLGFEFTEEDNERLKGVSRMTSLDILLEIGGLEFDNETKLTLAEQKNTNYRKFITKMTPDEILPGALEFLTEVKKKRYKVAIGSASKNTPTILQQIGLDTFFEAVADGNKISKAKPDPEVFLTAASEMGIVPEKCVVFEDAIAGVEAALAGNMKCVGIGEERRLNKAHFVLKSLVGVTVEEVLKRLG